MEIERNEITNHSSPDQEISPQREGRRGSNLDKADQRANVIRSRENEQYRVVMQSSMSLFMVYTLNRGSMELEESKVYTSKDQAKQFFIEEWGTRKDA